MAAACSGLAASSLPAEAKGRPLHDQRISLRAAQVHRRIKFAQL
jgi:hypothetical protein